MTAMLIRFADGRDYHSDETEYIPGPFPQEAEQNWQFKAMYEKDAQRHGWTLKECRHYLATGRRQGGGNPGSDSDDDSEDIHGSGKRKKPVTRPSRSASGPRRSRLSAMSTGGRRESGLSTIDLVDDDDDGYEDDGRGFEEELRELEEEAQLDEEEEEWIKNNYRKGFTTTSDSQDLSSPLEKRESLVDSETGEGDNDGD
jgi:hypothetical protein